MLKINPQSNSAERFALVKVSRPILFYLCQWICILLRTFEVEILWTVCPFLM